MFYSIVLSTDTSAYADGDLLADTQLVGAVGRAGRELVIDSVKIVDKDDQGGAMDLVFLKSNTTLGSENSAPTISDANVASEVVAQHVVAAADFRDYGGARVCHKVGLGIPLNLGSSSNLYVAVISRDSKTYTAAGLTLELGIRPR